MRDAEKETLLEERDRQEENTDALLRATGRLLERVVSAAGHPISAHVSGALLVL